MKFLDIIVSSSTAKESKLYAPAQKAFAVPETGVTIQSAAAYNVIKDCAQMSIRYIPHYIFGLYANPVSQLEGKFTIADIDEFYNASKNDIVLYQLLVIIINKIEPLFKSGETILQKNTNDPYGDFSELIERAPARDILISVFKAK